MWNERFLVDESQWSAMLSGQAAGVASIIANKNSRLSPKLMAVLLKRNLCL